MLTKFTLKVLHFAINTKFGQTGKLCIRDSVLNTEYSATDSEYTDDSGPDNTYKAVSKVRN